MKEMVLNNICVSNVSVMLPELFNMVRDGVIIEITARVCYVGDAWR